MDNAQQVTPGVFRHNSTSEIVVTEQGLSARRPSTSGTWQFLASAPDTRDLNEHYTPVRGREADHLLADARRARDSRVDINEQSSR